LSLQSPTKTIAHARAGGETALTVHCLGQGCHHQAVKRFEELKLWNDMIFVEVPQHRRLVSSKCGGRDLKVMPMFPARKGTPGYRGQHGVVSPRIFTSMTLVTVAWLNTLRMRGSGLGSLRWTAGKRTILSGLTTRMATKPENIPRALLLGRSGAYTLLSMIVE
jgi:hypothetical protein